jgi:argininosuccinate lyase
MLPGIKFNSLRMSSTAGEGYSTATDIAEYLVRKGVPFREAHEITGKIVLYCINKKTDLGGLGISELKTFSPTISNDIFSALDPAASVRARSSYGGTSPSEVLKQIRKYRKALK